MMLAFLISIINFIYTYVTTCHREMALANVAIFIILNQSMLVYSICHPRSLSSTPIGERRGPPI